MKLTTEQLHHKLMTAKNHFKSMRGLHVQEHDVYRHYKGGVYKVLFVSLHTETNEIMVNYQRIEGPDFDEHAERYIAFSRPFDNWCKPLPDDVIAEQKKLGRQTERFVPVVSGQKWIEVRAWPSGNSKEER